MASLPHPLSLSPSSKCRQKSYEDMQAIAVTGVSFSGTLNTRTGVQSLIATLSFYFLVAVLYIGSCEQRSPGRIHQHKWTVYIFITINSYWDLRHLLVKNICNVNWVFQFEITKHSLILTLPSSLLFDVLHFRLVYSSPLVDYYSPYSEIKHIERSCRFTHVQIGIYSAIIITIHCNTIWQGRQL